VNCASLNENLLESELFGHVKGAFTGADRNRVGRFEAAHGGTIFLDEIGDIPMATQVKLFRVLEEKEIERVGDHQPIKVDVRIITATNKNLEELVSQKHFREDLYFRINVFPLLCPPLADRREDIPMIVQSFIKQNNLKSNKDIQGITSEALKRLIAYPWPGNVRELRNTIEYAFVLCPGGDIDVQHLPPKIAGNGEPLRGRVQDDVSYNQKKEEMIEVLRRVGGNQSEAARLLGVSRVTIWKRIKKYGIDLEEVLNNNS
jgi:transcriptional regulator with PAS, ATPase and Fis domain